MVLLVLCCTWETIEATPAIRLLACDLFDANEDSLRRLKICVVSVPRKRSRNVLPVWRWTRDEKILQRMRMAIGLEIDTRARVHSVCMSSRWLRDVSDLPWTANQTHPAEAIHS